MPIIKLVVELVENPEDHAIHDREIKQIIKEIYYPSSVVRNFFKVDEQLTGIEFIRKAMQAMKEANKAVIKKYGFPCMTCFYHERELLKLKQVLNLEKTSATIKELKG
ncbi:MAG: hypothetical protein ACTSVI_01945 [Promethearchaeota archaeon]